MLSFKKLFFHNNKFFSKYRNLVDIATGRATMQRLRYKKLARIAFILVVLVMSFNFMKNSYGANKKFVLISHATDSDSWWNPVKNAIKQAGEDFDVSVDYRNTSSGDLADMSRLIA